ncbi:MAG: S8 family serine peptidase [Halanaerobiales bacterium]|nr:S8 family serine peptidase [Halanaerobiales bacterium]
MKKKFIAGLLLISLIVIVSSCFGISQAGQPDLQYYVKAGDSLYKLARQYNTTIEVIKSYNQLHTNVIYIGQLLLIPVSTRNSPAQVYYVKAGDSLYKISLRYNTTVAALKDRNNLQSDLIMVGQRLFIPDTHFERRNNNYYQVRGRVAVSNQTFNGQSLGTVGSRAHLTSQSLCRPTASSGFVEAEIIVKYKPTVNSQTLDQLAKSNNLVTLSQLETGAGRIVHYQVPGDTELEQMIENYRQLANVDWVEPNYLYYPTAIPSDQYYQNYQWDYLQINLEAAWDQEKGDRSVTVAVIDTGVITNHPDLKNNLLSGADFVGGRKGYPIEAYNVTDYDPTDETPLSEGGSHGTHVAGIIGAVTNNYLGIAGINWLVNILPVRALKKSGGTSWDIAEGIYYAIDQGVDIINLSLGSRHFSHLQQEAIRAAYRQGITIVAATGNENSTVYFPAAFPETIAVGSVGSKNKKAAYSNYGPEVDVVAPGGDYGEAIYSTWGYFNEGQAVASYTGMIGTSMATPHVSGLAALLVASGVEQVEHIRELLTSTAIDLGQTGKDVFYGYGLVDAYAALLGKKLTKPVVFIASREGSKLQVQSEIKVVNDDGSFLLERVEAGPGYLIAWRDVNENNLIDSGDYYGESKQPLTITDDISAPELVVGYLSYDNNPGYQVFR